MSFFANTQTTQNTMHDDILADTNYGKPTKSWFIENPRSISDLLFGFFFTPHAMATLHPDMKVGPEPCRDLHGVMTNPYKVG